MLSNIHCAEDIELIISTIKLSGNKSLTVVAYYRPSNKTDEMYLTISNREISNLKRQCKNSIFLVEGDFNLPDINWSDTSIEGSQYSSRVNQATLDMVVENNLEQLVDFPTRKSKTLDLIFSSYPSYMERCKLLPSIGNSDHDIVLLDIYSSMSPKASSAEDLFVEKCRHQWYLGGLDTFCSNFKDRPFESVNSMWDLFKEQINKNMERRVPSKITLARHTHPWMNGRIRRLIRRKQRAHKKSRTTGIKWDIGRYRRL